ncbi:MAG: HlyD family efflux transporter periplasmic adaptor subunit [Deltaproteobacteria bacterium]|nr:HlyD family efflux transporter periplasmic adaptor subunit [Deltaproteobacteria bacterium]
MKKQIIIIVVFSLLVLLVAGVVYFGQWKGRTHELYYSGTIEATQYRLSFQVSGKVLQVLADEGHAVSAGELLAELEPQELQARHDQARANYERAQAALRTLSAQMKEIRTGNRPQDIERARQAFLSAKAVMEEARKNMQKYRRLFEDGVVSEKEWDAAQLRYDVALHDYERNIESYDLAKEGSRMERIEAIQAEVQGAKAQVISARAAWRQAEIQLAYRQLKASVDGIITSRNVEPGEVVTPAQEVMTLADLSVIDLKIFVGETEIGQVKPGQMVDVRVDTFPDRIYQGTVAYISPEAEFTPKMIQTHKERVKLVYLVKVSIPNPDMELKSAMPADAWLK